MKKALCLAGLLGLALVLGLWWWLPEQGGEGAALPATSSLPAPAQEAPLALLPEPEPELASEDAPLLPLPEAAPVDAVSSLSRAREEGDIRMPPLQRSEERPELPTAAELADPKAYQRYEMRQSQRLYQAYMQAADQELPRLQEDIVRARAEGLSPEELAKGEEKLRRIQAMRDQLAADHPALAP